MLQIVVERDDMRLYLPLRLALEPNSQWKSVDSDLIISIFLVFAVVNSFRALDEPKSLFFAKDVASFASVGYNFSFLLQNIHPLERIIMIGLSINRVGNRLKSPFLLIFILLALHQSVRWHFSLFDTCQCCIFRLLKVNITKRMRNNLISQQISPYTIDRRTPSWRQVEDSELLYNLNVFILYFIRYSNRRKFVVFEGILLK